jgi:2-dehydropantoate 2-reductase
VRVLSVGAGAVGGTVAARLQRAGADVRVFDVDPEHVARLRDPGLRVDGVDGGVTTPLDASTDLPLEAPDVILLAVRSGATLTAVASIAGLVGPHTDVVSLQNGLNEDRIAGAIGADHTIGCVVGFGATWLEAGHVELDAVGDLTIGRLDGALDGRLVAVRDLLDLAFPTRVTDNVAGALWAKILVNSMTVMGALGGMLTGELLATPQRRAIVSGVVAEGTRVARAGGVELLPIFGSVSPDEVGTATWEPAMQRVLARFGERFGAIRSVTWRDFELGRPTEVDAVTGEIVRRGEAYGVPTPLNAAVYAMLGQIEAGERAPVAHNLDALVALRS